VQFSFPAELLYPVIFSLTFPITLAVVSRSRLLRGRNAAQFFVASLVHLAAWVGGSLFLPAGYTPHGASGWLISSMVVGSFLMIYLEAWALLSRGYTLAMLLALLESPSPLAADAIAARYRSGDGLEWIFRHRLAGLEAAGMIRKEGADLALTPRLGAFVVMLYRVAIAVFGLRKTG
jgi:hypothetical protein